MAFVYYNPNPFQTHVGDCSVRAISKALGKDWEDSYISLCAEGLYYRDMPSSNYVWGMYLLRFGFKQRMIDSICPKCISVSEFTEEHPSGTYVLGCEGHVVTAVDGDYFDSWDSGHKTVLFYFEKEE